MVGEILTEAEFIIIGFFFFVLCEFVTDVKHNASFLKGAGRGFLTGIFLSFCFRINYIIIRFYDKNKTFFEKSLLFFCREKEFQSILNVKIPPAPAVVALAFFVGVGNAERIKMCF